MRWTLYSLAARLRRGARPSLAASILLASCGLLASCARGPAPEVSPPAPTLRRLTQVQYENTVHDLFGADVVVMTDIEPDEEAGGLLSVGASLEAISPRGVEKYEQSAYQIAQQVLEDPVRRDAVVPCDPAGTRDDDCAARFVEETGERVWRRPVTADEEARLVAVAGQAADTLGSFDGGLEYALAAMLQSPSFLFRAELGEDDPDGGGRRYSSWEMASRLSYFLWNTTPDDELLAAASDDELVTDDGLEAQVDRLLADDRAKTGVRNLFTEMLQLEDLDDLNKDPLVFVHMSPEVGPSAREETLLGIERVAFDEDGDFRDLLTTRTTFVDRKLAAIYGIQAPTPDGFGEVELPADGGREGLLGQVSFLAPNAHPGSSSVTLRGKYVREVLLCQEMPSPPANLNTAIPEASEDLPTMRDRVAQHLSDPFCASCHNSMDPIGLGFENFDGLGGWRTEENGATIDPSSELDGEPFDDAVGLAERLHDDDKVTRCVAETVYRYASGHVVDAGEEDLVGWHAEGFDGHGDRLLWLLRDVALSPGFRKTAEVQ